MKNKSVRSRFINYVSGKVTYGQGRYQRLSQKPLFSVVQKILLRLNRYRISGKSAETAFYLLMALVPFMIFFISLFGLLSQSLPFRGDVLFVMRDIMPEPVFSYISSILDEIKISQNITFLSFSMLGFIWASSKGFTVILQGLNQIYSGKSVRKPVNPILLRFLGLGFAVLIVLSLLVSAVLITFGDLLFQQISSSSGQTAFSGTFAQISRYVVSFVFLLIVFSLLFYLASHRKGRFIRAVPGASFTAGSWILFSVVFSWYVNNYGIFAKVYGSLTSIILLMFWLYFCIMMILTGGIIHELILERYIRKNNMESK